MRVPRVRESISEMTAVVILVAAMIDAHAPERVENWISKGPYIQSPAPDKVFIIWESQTNYPATVRVRAPGLKHLTSDLVPRVLTGVSTSSETNRPKTTNMFYLYEAQFERLQPGKDYACYPQGSRIITAADLPS